MPEATFTSRGVLATGATRGVGRAIAAGFGRRGGPVLVAGRDREPGENVAGPIRSRGGRAGFIPADLRDVPSAQDLARRATEVAGQASMLAGTAGIAVSGPAGAAREADLGAVDGLEEANRGLDDTST